MSKRDVPNWCKRGKIRYSQLYAGPLEFARNITFIPDATVRKQKGPKSEEADRFIYHLMSKLPECIFHESFEYYTKEVVGWLLEAHINVFHILFSIGFGIEAEEMQRKAVEPVVKICHERGIKTIAYLGGVLLNWPRFFKDYPGSQNWIQVDADGKPIETKWFTRYAGCINNPNWVNYLKETAKMALDMKFDGIYFDCVWFSPAGCYCDVCKGKFADYSEERLGKRHDIPKRPNWKDPVWQAFIIFRFESLSGFLSEFKEYIRSINPEVVFIFNGAHNEAVTTGATRLGGDVYSIGEISDILYYEAGPFPRLESGRLLRPITLLKHGVSITHGKPVVQKAYLPPDKQYPKAALTPKQVKLSVAQSIAFCISFNAYNIPVEMYYPTIIEDPRTRKALGQYNAFLEEYEDYYVDAESLADVAVLWSSRTRDWYCNDKEDHECSHHQGFCEALIDSHITFDVLYEEDLNADNLSRYKVLVAPNIACMSKTSANSIKEFIQRGGGLVATYETSLYDENYKKRRDFALSEVFGLKYGQKSSKPVRRGYGDGKVVYFPTEPDRDYWVERRLRDLKKLTDALKWTTREPLSLYTEAPSTVFVNMFKQPGKILIHLVNYNLDKENDQPMPLGNIKLKIRVPTEVKQIFAISPDFNDRKDLQSEVISDKAIRFISFTVPGLELYDLVVIELSEEG